MLLPRVGPDRCVSTGVAHAPVEHLDHVAPARARGADEVRHAQERQDARELRRVRLGRLGHGLERHGRAGDCAQLHDPPRQLLERHDARPERVLELQRPLRRADEEQVAHDLVDEERVPIRLFGQRLDVDRHPGRQALDEPRRQRVRVFLAEALELDPAHVAGDRLLAGRARAGRARPRRASSRKVAMRSRFGSSGGWRSTLRSARLSSSAHCRSSMTTISGRCSVTRTRSSRIAPNARDRSS